MTTTPINVPKKLAIYYAFPSLINGANGNVTSAVNVFKVYDMVVFGAGLEKMTHADHAKTIQIINHPLMVGTQVFGYIDATRMVNDFQTRTDQWKAMGVKGILLDRFGYDFGVTRSKQNTLINYVHSKGLIAFVNAWNPDDVFGSSVVPLLNTLGTAPVINSGDWFLAPSYQIIDGAYQTASDWKTKADKMATYKAGVGTKIACSTTTTSSIGFDQAKLDYAYYSTALYNFDAFAWGEPDYSATSATLPLRTRIPFLGTHFTGPIVTTSAGVFERQTNVGIRVDTVGHVPGTIL